MVERFSTRSADLQPCELAPDVLLAIGRLIRAFADIEDIVTLLLCKLAQIPERKAVMLLGRTPMTTRLRMAGEFAVAHGGDAEKVFAMCFKPPEFQKLLETRNVACHGVLLGMTDNGHLAFLTQKALAASSASVTMEVISYEPSAFAMSADVAEALVNDFEQILQLASLRERRRAQSLGPHSKSQATKRPSPKRESPPESSPR